MFTGHKTTIGATYNLRNGKNSLTGAVCYDRLVRDMMAGDVNFSKKKKKTSNNITENSNSPRRQRKLAVVPRVASLSLSPKKSSRKSSAARSFSYGSGMNSLAMANLHSNTNSSGEDPSSNRASARKKKKRRPGLKTNKQY